MITSILTQVQIASGKKCQDQSDSLGKKLVVCSDSFVFYEFKYLLNLKHNKTNTRVKYQIKNENVFDMLSVDQV